MTSIIVIGKVLQKNINLLILRKDYNSISITKLI